MVGTQTISVALAVFNEANNLEACLRSVKSFADEIVIVDGGSTDKTIDIAKRYTNTIIKTDNPPVFHINKQKALDACTGDWILQLDADEIVPEPLKKEIREAITSPSVHGYYIPRKNYFWGQWMKKGGQYPDYVIRLIRRGKARFPAKTVHEQIAVDGNVGYLKEPMEHYSYRSNKDYWRKADAYTTLTAMEMKTKSVPKSIATWFLYNIVKPKVTFFTLFFRHKGFMDGWRGFLFAVFSAMHFPIAYRKFIKMALILLLFLAITVPAQADYVLPYPSFMPGNKLYTITRMVDKLKGFWYFGNIAQIKYHLALSDKYLVEAKTLMEYSQYLLATDALRRSDSEFMHLPKLLREAKAQYTDIQVYKKLIIEAGQKHSEVLSTLAPLVPSEFVWRPEKGQSSDLHIGTMLKNASSLRESVIQDVNGM